MIHFGKDLAESERRFAVLRTGYAAICCMVGGPALLVAGTFKRDDWLFPVAAGLVIIGGVVAILKCIGEGSARTRCDCEEESDRP